MPTINIHDVSYHYTISEATAGEPPSPPLVLLHGFTGSAANWRPLQDALAPRFTTIAIDLLGHGQSDAPADPARYAMAQSARDVAALLSAVVPGPVHLLGYSMGGRLALYLALTYPQRVQRLVLESASPGLAEAAARRDRVASDEALADRIEVEGVPAFVAHWEQIPLFASQQSLPDAVRSRLREQRLRNRAVGLANSLRGMGTGVQPALWDRLPALAMPVLLLSGEHDAKFCAIARQMAAQMPAATHVTIPDAGHTIHLERPDAFRRTVHSFLEE